MRFPMQSTFTFIFVAEKCANYTTIEKLSCKFHVHAQVHVNIWYMQKMNPKGRPLRRFQTPPTLTHKKPSSLRKFKLKFPCTLVSVPSGRQKRILENAYPKGHGFICTQPGSFSLTHRTQTKCPLRPTRVKLQHATVLSASSNCSGRGLNSRHAAAGCEFFRLRIVFFPLREFVHCARVFFSRCSTTFVTPENIFRPTMAR